MREFTTTSAIGVLNYSIIERSSPSSIKVSYIESETATRWARTNEIDPNFDRLVVAGLSGANAALYDIAKSDHGLQKQLEQIPLFETPFVPNAELVGVLQSRKNSSNAVELFTNSLTLLNTAAAGTKLSEHSDVEFDGEASKMRASLPQAKWQAIGSIVGAPEVMEMGVDYKSVSDPATVRRPEFWVRADIYNSEVPTKEFAIVSFLDTMYSSIAVDVRSIRIRGGRPEEIEGDTFAKLNNFSKGVYAASEFVNKRSLRVPTKKSARR